MKKKGYLLRNRIIRAVLVAVLAQSILFGAILILSGGFSALTRLPYQTMRVRLKDKNDAVSNTMHQIYLEGIGLKRQIGRNATEKEIHTMLIDVLNKVNYLSGVAYVSLNDDTGVAYMDSEPQEYSVNASDINCLIGTSLADTGVGMSNKWQKGFDGAYAYIKEIASARESGDCWFYDRAEGAFYYKIYTDDHMLLMQMREDDLADLLEAGSIDTEMQFRLADDDGGFYTRSDEMEPMTVPGQTFEDMELISWTSGGEEYVGYRETVGLYGKFEAEKTLYVTVLCKKSLVQSPARMMLVRISIAYAISLAICFIACWSSTGMILKPLKQMLEDIQGQKGRIVRFKSSPAAEIQSIYNALHDMTKRLEESYSRYNLTMEEVGQNLGSFLYHYDTELTDVTSSVEEILCIPKEELTPERELTKEAWERIRAKLTPFPELGAFLFHDAENQAHCVSFKTKEEEKGMFGVVMDKTAEYQKISQLRFVSEHDFLTKLHNASYMREQGSRLLEKHKDKVNAMLFCDLDNLKYVNDNYGHSMGNAYIVAMADRMRGCAAALKEEKPQTDVIAARISGDEFAMLFTGFETREEVRDAVIALYSRKCTISLSEEREYSVRVSIGFVYADENNHTIEKLLKCADVAMYSIKSKSKNGIAVYLGEDHTEEIDLSQI